jgi:hypothetical protein
MLAQWLRKKFMAEFEDSFTAAAFAEAGEFETAKLISRGRKQKPLVRKRLLGRRLKLRRA